MGDKVEHTDDVRMQSPEVTALFEEMVKQGSDTMDFALNREPEIGRTFSKDGIDDFFDAIELFIGARLQAHFKKRGKNEFGPHRMTVKVVVGIDGESWDVGDSLKPWYTTVDGSTRGKVVGS